MKNITAVVCSWNSIKTIEKCLKSLISNNISVIVVDANSDDGTKDIAKNYADKLLTDPRKGLALARNIGIKHVKTKYVLNWGVDNILPDGQIDLMVNYLEKNKFSGVSAQTFTISKSKNYLSKSLNSYRQTRFYPGERKVIGTPTLFHTTLLKINKYDNKMSHSDDGDLCLRLEKKKHKFAISDAYVYEDGYESIHSLVTRWRNYGKSDYEIFSKYSKHWNFSRKIRSILYPFINELIVPMLKLSFINKFKVFPFLILITILRYFFWIKYLIYSK